MKEDMTMGYAPLRCPRCGEITLWKKSDSSYKGFSVGKAIVGSSIFGPLGASAGALGKRKSRCRCGKCGYSEEFDG